MCAESIQKRTQNAHRLHRRAVRYHRKGDGYLWVTAHAAAHIVGRYEKGATLSLAHDLRVSVDQVENYARGYLFYAYLRVQFRPRSEVRRLRKELTLSHFYKLAKLNASLELSPAEWVYYMQEAEEYGTSSGYLVRMIAEQHEDKTAPEWVRQFPRAKIQETIDTADAPPKVKGILRGLLAVLEE